MLVAVLTITDENIEKTRKSFESLHMFSGIEFHHYVIDLDSHDGTDTFLEHQQEEGGIKFLHHAGRKQPYGRSINFLVEKALRHGGYDSIVLMEPDCLLYQEHTLDRLTFTSVDSGAVISPIVDGSPINQIGPVIPVTNGRVRDTGFVGRTMISTPIGIWSQFRIPEDEGAHMITRFARDSGLIVGHLEGCRVATL